MSTELTLGLARGFRQRRDQQREQATIDADRQRRVRREDAADTRALEDAEYRKSQRPAQERLQSLQLDNAERQSQQQQRTIEDARKAAEAEGFYDLMDQLERGIDPSVAIRQYNSRGSHKIEPSTFKYDPASKQVQFIDDDGQPFAGEVSQIKGVLRDTLTPSGSKGAQTKVRDDELILDANGKEIFRGPNYGKSKDTGSKAVIKGKAGDWYRDPDTKKWAQIPGDKNGGGKGGLPGGNKAGTWSMQNAQKSVREILASKVGLKYDPETEQIIGGKPGATDAWLELAARGDDVLSRVKDTMGPAQIAHMVADAYSGVLPLPDYQAEATKNTQRMRMHDATKPDSWYTQAETEDAFQARVLENAKKARSAAIAQGDATLEKNLMPFLPAADEEEAVAADAGDAGAYETDEEGEPINPDDELPAVDGGAAPQPAAQARGPRAHYPVTVDRVRAGSDVQAQKALTALRANPTILGLLTAPAEPGKATVVKFPDGNLYYLAGDELKRLNMKPPAKGK